MAITEGTSLSYENLNAKGKVTAKSKTTYLDIRDSLGATVYDIETVFSKANGDYLSSRKFEAKCLNGKFYLDFKKFETPDAMKQFQDMDVDIYTKDISYPQKLSVGESLPDAILTISDVGKSGANTTFVILKTNWKVISKESVTVPAGTFDCFKITYDMSIKTSTERNHKVCEYVSTGVGKIKMETYNEKGKLKSSAVLVELEK